jgi:hypothetical protein
MRSFLVALSVLSIAACGGDGGGSAAPPEFFRVVFVGEGSGAGRVRATQGTNLDCPVSSSLNCDTSVEDGTTLNLEATANEASTFIGWSGDGSGCGTVTTCTVTVDRALTLRVRFDQAFPAVAGVYNVTGTFDGLPASEASFSGTLTLTQASRTAGTLAGSAAFVVRIGTDVFNVADNILDQASVSISGVVVFTLSDASGTWTFTGTHVATRFGDGRHTLSAGGDNISGSWQASQATTGIAAQLSAHNRSGMEEIAKRLLQ